MPRVQGALYAVGDLHGRLDLLEELVDRILRDALDPDLPAEGPPVLAFVGDLIDRGPDSAGVLEFLSAIRQWPDFECVFIMGNHEEMLLKFLDNPVQGRRWIRFGGYETLLSYGLNRLGDLDDDDNLVALAGQLRSVMGEHLRIFEELVASYQFDNVLVTHAGADPSMPAAAQPPKVLAWGCDAFLKTRRTDGLWVVHGHHIVDEPSIQGGRIAIDTGAYTTGRLTALRLVGEDASFLSATGEATPQEDC